jgi:hypothetical protein
MHVVCQTVVSCGGSQLIRQQSRVANLGDFSPKKRKFRESIRFLVEFQKLIFKKWFEAQTKHSSLFLKLF